MADDVSPASGVLVDFESHAEAVWAKLRASDTFKLAMALVLGSTLAYMQAWATGVAVLSLGDWLKALVLAVFTLTFRRAIASLQVAQAGLPDPALTRAVPIDPATGRDNAIVVTGEVHGPGTVSPRSSTTPLALIALCGLWSAAGCTAAQMQAVEAVAKTDGHATAIALLGAVTAARSNPALVAEALSLVQTAGPTLQLPPEVLAQVEALLSGGDLDTAATILGVLADATSSAPVGPVLVAPLLVAPRGGDEPPALSTGSSHGSIILGGQ